MNNNINIIKTFIKVPKKSEVVKASMNNVWNKGNNVLYDLCRKYPKHNTDDEILAKIWLIGRSYSASIERRKNKSKMMSGDSFYEDIVACEIRKSSIDR